MFKIELDVQSAIVLDHPRHVSSMTLCFTLDMLVIRPIFRVLP